MIVWHIQCLLECIISCGAAYLYCWSIYETLLIYGEYALILNEHEPGILSAQQIFAFVSCLYLSTLRVPTIQPLFKKAVHCSYIVHLSSIHCMWKKAIKLIFMAIMSQISYLLSKALLSYWDYTFLLRMSPRISLCSGKQCFDSPKGGIAQGKRKGATGRICFFTYWWVYLLNKYQVRLLSNIDNSNRQPIINALGIKAQLLPIRHRFSCNPPSGLHGTRVYSHTPRSS